MTVEYKDLITVKRTADHSTSEHSTRDIHLQIDGDAVDAYIKIHGSELLIDGLILLLGEVRARRINLLLAAQQTGQTVAEAMEEAHGESKGSATEDASEG